MEKLTSIQFNILSRLADYKFLTLSQLLRLNCGTIQYKYLWKQASSLYTSKRNLIGRVSFRNIDRLGRIEDIYFLTRAGYNVLVDLDFSPEKILMPKSKSVTAKDYKHRLTTIDFQIELNTWAKDNGFNVGECVRYFDSKGNNRRDSNLTSLAKISDENGSSIIPDAIFNLYENGFRRLLLFELHLGNDSRRIYDQIVSHSKFLVQRFTHKHLNYPKNRAYYIVILFEKTNTMRNTISRIVKEKSTFENISNLFFCKALDGMGAEHFESRWLSLTGAYCELRINAGGAKSIK